MIKMQISFKNQKILYLQQLVSQVGLNQPVVQSDVKQLVLRPLCQTEYLLKLQENNIS